MPTDTLTLTLNKKAADASLRPTAAAKKAAAKNGLQGQDSNLRHRGYEPRALPTELPCCGSRGLRFALRCFAEQLKMIQPNQSGNPARLPVMHTLRSDVGAKAQHFGDFCRAAEAINDFCICLHGYSLNAAFSFCQTQCLT